MGECLQARPGKKLFSNGCRKNVICFAQSAKGKQTDIQCIYKGLNAFFRNSIDVLHLFCVLFHSRNLFNNFKYTKWKVIWVCCLVYCCVGRHIAAWMRIPFLVYQRIYSKHSPFVCVTCGICRNLSTRNKEAVYQWSYFYFLEKCAVQTDLKCGGTTRLRKVTLRNPAKQKSECTYTIKPMSSKVCQVRIDFDMVLAQPTTPDNNSPPKCIDDKLVINDIELCGSNMNQHSWV